MKYTIIASLLLIVAYVVITQKYVFVGKQEDMNKVTKIAHQMRTVGLQCCTSSCEEMQKKRLQFLNDNKDATIQEFVEAMEMKIDGKDIVTLLQSSNCVVCKEYAHSVIADLDRGHRALDKNFGTTTIETVMYWKLL